MSSKVRKINYQNVREYNDKSDFCPFIITLVSSYPHFITPVTINDCQYLPLSHVPPSYEIDGQHWSLAVITKQTEHVFTKL
jgi:hypothetical protein